MLVCTEECDTSCIQNHGNFDTIISKRFIMLLPALLPTSEFNDVSSWQWLSPVWR